MKAIQLVKGGLPGDAESFATVELERPRPSGGQLLVEVRAISVNPVDTKVRKGHEEKPARIIGWDASGVVAEVGPDVDRFQVGDEIYYAGELTQPGCHQQFQLVDQRIVAKKPKTLSHAQAAAIPLTGLTAWEGLFDRLGISPSGADSGKSILIIGGAGGVGSLAIQLAHVIGGLHVCASASRPESNEWVRKMGAIEVANHAHPLNEEVKKLGKEWVDYVFCLNSTDDHWDAMVDIVGPQGRICSIVEATQPHNVQPLMNKSAGFVWELMFSRTLHQTPDVARQGEILERLAGLLDEGRIKGTATSTLSPISAENIDRAHQSLKEGHTLGKIVIEGWD